MKNLYCCNTYYHLLISIIKSIKNKDNNTLLVFTDRNNDVLFSNKELLKRVKESKIFDNVLLFDYSKEELEADAKLFPKISWYILVIKLLLKNKYEFKNYDNIYQFFDCSLLGRLISYKHLYYTLLEDGTDTFKVNNRNYSKSFGYYVRKLLGNCKLAQSKYIKEIEVNSISNLNIYGKKLKEVNKKKMFESLSKSEMEKIINIFIPNMNFNLFNDSNLIITQPLSEDNHIKNEREKIKVYEKIINEYAEDGNIVIKPHPREKTDYSKYIKNSYIVKDIFPIELINFYPVKLNKIITITSTSINLIDNCNEKIFLGWNWLEKELRKAKYEK